MTKKIGIIIQARMASTRLPNKIMLNLAGKPMLWHVIDRCKKANVDEVIVATSTNKENDIIENFCKKNNVLFFRGSEDDVLERYYQAAKKYELDIIIRVTSDCPLIDPEIINKSIEEFKKNHVDYLSNVHIRSYPRGVDVEIFKFDALQKAHELEKEKNQREHVTVFIYSHPEMFKIGGLVAEGILKNPEIRLCIDTKDDFALLNRIYDEFYREGKIIDLKQIIKFMDKNPALKEINIKSEEEHLKRNISDNVNQKFLVKNKIKIENKFMGENEKVFMIAEISGNHNQNYETAVELIKTICEAGADAIKLQTYTPDTLTINSDKKWFQVEVNKAWKGKNLYDLYKIAHMPWEWQPKLAEIAKKYNIPLFSTPFDKTAVDFLEKMNVPIYKIASFEIGDLELLKKIASTKKPVIMSRGMASLEEIKLAYKILKENGCPNIAILHCVSSYPSLPEEMNLSTILDLKTKFPDAIIGLSDHTLTTETAVAGVALGAKIIEKHVILNRKEGGVDSAFSLEPDEFKNMVRQVRNVEKAIGTPHYGVGERESENVVFKRSLFVVKDITKDEEFNKENVRCIRPGYGLKPKYLNDIIGKKAKQDIERGTPLSLDLIKS